MGSIISDYYKPLFSEGMFVTCKSPANYPANGECWQLTQEFGSGNYWIYESSNNFNIKLHDFWFHNDSVIDMSIPECLSVTFYESISGEELNPYKHLTSNVVSSFLGGYKPFKAIIHKKIPIRSIGIEYEPAYYETYLKKHYGSLYQSPQEAFRCIDETTDFPEMILLLNQIKNYHGNGISSELFYDAKAAEALSLIFERHQKLNSHKKVKISSADQEMLETVVSYIKDHYADDLTINMLSKLACMGTTKFKKCFKARFGCTAAEYIEERRIGQAEHFLSYTDLSVVSVAQAVGFSNPGRFASLFRKTTGLLPSEYKKIIQKES